MTYKMNGTDSSSGHGHVDAESLGVVIRRWIAAWEVRHPLYQDSGKGHSAPPDKVDPRFNGDSFFGSSKSERIPEMTAYKYLEQWARVSPRTIYAILNERRTVQWDVADRLCCAMGCPEVLYTGEVEVYGKMRCDD